MNKLFPTETLVKHLSRFNIYQTLPDYEDKLNIIREWTEKLRIGGISAEKEESLKGNFLNDFFGEVLGFNKGNSSFYMLRLEQKSSTDATKADAALGYFRLINTEIAPEVHAVIEIKGIETELDQKQKRKGFNDTAVSQAFLYASKTFNPCKWVIVSNFKEIRFYHYQSGQGKCQSYLVEELLEENKLKEMVFLFHKDFLISKNVSQTENLIVKTQNSQTPKNPSDHILDEMFAALKKFGDFGFVDPRLIANLYPFNILDEYVWHYERMRLFTINPKIYVFFEGITIKERNIEIQENLSIELETQVADYQQKLNFVFQFLNQSMIYEISSVKDYDEVSKRNKATIGFDLRHEFSFLEEEGLRKDIFIMPITTCNCLSCMYRTLDVTQFLTKLKSAFGNPSYDTLEFAYGNYLISSDNFKRTYQILRNIEKTYKKKAGHEVIYFLARLNLKYLHNLIRDYNLDDKGEILKYIRGVDIDRTIANEVEIHVDEEVRQYLLEIKEGRLIGDIEKKVTEIVDGIKRQRDLLENGGYVGDADFEGLHFQYMLLYSFVNRNFLIYDVFTNYKAILRKVFEGLILSFSTKNAGLQSFDGFYLTEATIHLSNKDLRELLNEVEVIKISAKDLEQYLEKVNNFLISFFSNGIFGEPYRPGLIQESLSSISFNWKISDLFGNIMLILSKTDLNKSAIQKLAPSIIGFLKTEDELAHWNLKDLCNLIRKNGELFEVKQLLEILEFAIENCKYGSNKYNDLINGIPGVIFKFFPDFKISNKGLLLNAVARTYTPKGVPDLRNLVPLYKILDVKLASMLLDEFDAVLTENFDYMLYELLLQNKVIGVDRNKYFEEFVELINKRKGKGYTGDSNKGAVFEDFVFYNFAVLVYFLQIDLKDRRIKKIRCSSTFENWLLNPMEFDYSEFDVNWVRASVNQYILRELGTISTIRAKIEEELDKTYDAKLAKIYFRYFR